MQQHFTLRYGRSAVPLTVTADRIDVIASSAPDPIADLPEAFRAAVEEQAIQSPPLHALIAADDLVTVIVSDLTRAWMHQERICPLLLDYLHDRCGVPDAGIVFLVALGTHRAMTEAELRSIVSDSVFDRVRVVNHDSSGPFVPFGVTSRGTPVQLNPLAAGRKVILMGGTVHHLLAGYGGGRKSILPGIASPATISANHAMALDPVLPKSSDLVGCGVTVNNPVHEDMLEAAYLAAPVFGINIVVNSAGDQVALPSGHFDHAWRESCRLVDALSGVPIEKRADAVVVSCGGFPKDINLYQGSKTLINAYQAVKPGGTIVFLCECPEGGGPAEFFAWSRFLPSGTLDSELRANFTIAGYIFYVCAEIAANCGVHMLTSISPQVTRDMGITGYSSAESLASALDFSGKHVIVMPFGSNTVPIPPR